MNARQLHYLEVLAKTGSQVQARKAAGVTTKTVGNWRGDEEFLGAVDEAIEAANDAIRAKVREMALAGETSMLTLSMKVIEPALRPAGTNVALQVNTTQSAVPDVDAVRLADQLNNLHAQLANRVQGQLPVPVVDPGPLIEVPAAAQEAAGAPIDSSEGEGHADIC
ncbi:hypothetical protein [Zeimonas arvi]|uniref:Uncharacterized protein n=1 Tax=Zeimonas arvi TaxID=2498847 RepID=A0A5C8NR33_9BURK|nr:hypothetical protein [Zeimonas arvi]TXL63557.1 hypothetical protein FHP08_17125 [Zeimonas arvi]